LLKSFIQRYSDTFYADLARERIEQLEASTNAPGVAPVVRPSPNPEMKSAALPPDPPNAAISNRPAASATAYPTKSVSMVIPFAPGGASDVLGRIVAQRMSEILGQPVVVENVPGAGGMIGSKRVADAAPEGYSFVVGNVVTHALSQTLFRAPPFRASDFTPVALIGEFPMVLIARKGMPANNLKEFVAYAKANQSKITYGSTGAGTASQLGCVLLNQLIGVDATHVPYRGTAPALQDLLAGQIDYMCDAVSVAKPHIDGGKVKPIALLSKERSKALPNVPTGLEQ
jgi:tripartite-type tricarboxylate transporter receptor subunit TctC